MRVRAISGWAVLVALSFIVSNCLAAPRRPLVFIPGVLGSKLCDDKGKVIWGDVNSYINLHLLDLSEKSDRLELHACGPISEVKVLGPLYTVHQYDSLFKFLQRLGYRVGENLLIYSYDWRQSNYDSADDFNKKITAAGYKPGPQITNFYGPPG